ncbi:hypothetical protein [Kitasatospora kifunensis]|uniref:Uncharacterized protein n=1 Tax=Kitasatospora kifunensis TaxID=58351 RepID=A0A7W7VUU8_KITKI|nr:hypothetical protein [Kitasatospora kifunensis]MBB4923203.1 hypothetical protein [Kitasatospora kifunensis]
MTLGIPLVALLALIVYLLVRSGELRVWHVILTGLLGFYLDRTHLAEPIGAAVVWIAKGLTHTT